MRRVWIIIVALGMGLPSLAAADYWVLRRGFPAPQLYTTGAAPACSSDATIMLIADTTSSTTVYCQDGAEFTGGGGGLSFFTHAIDCLTNVTTAVIGEECLDLDDGRLWKCTSPGGGTDTNTCDAAEDWIGGRPIWLDTDETLTYLLSVGTRKIQFCNNTLYDATTFCHRFSVSESGGPVYEGACGFTAGVPNACDPSIEIADGKALRIKVTGGATGVLVDEDEIETFDLAERSTNPAAQASVNGRWKLFFKSDGLYYQDDAATPTVTGPLGAGSTLTVKEADDSPTVTNVSSITVTNGTLTDNTGGSVTVTTGGTGGGSMPPIRPFSAIPVTAGVVAECPIDGVMMMCVDDGTALTTDAIWRTVFQLPSTMPAACTWAIVVDVVSGAAGETGTIKINPKWAIWAAGSDRPTSPTGEGTTADTVTGVGSGTATVTFSSDQNDWGTVEWTMNAATAPASGDAGKRVLMDLTIEDTGTTTADTVGLYPWLVCK